MTISSWLLSVAGVGVISVLIDVVLPNGQTNKYVKGMFAFIMLFVIISPIPTLLKSDFDLEKIFSSTQIEVEEDFIYQVNRTKLNYLENQIKSRLLNEGIDSITVTVNGDIFDSNMQIKNVFVDLKNVVINKKEQHIDIKKTVKDIVFSVCDIKEEELIIYG